MRENLKKRTASDPAVSAIEASPANWIEKFSWCGEMNFEGSLPCEFSSSCSVQCGTSHVANMAPTPVKDMCPHNSSWECLVGNLSHICGSNKLITQRSQASRLWLDNFRAHIAHTHMYTQLIQLLMPFQGLFPATEAELTQLKTALRRMGHILERAPGNLREYLRTGTAAAFLFQEQWEPAHCQ